MGHSCLRQTRQHACRPWPRRDMSVSWINKCWIAPLSPINLAAYSLTCVYCHPHGRSRHQLSSTEDLLVGTGTQSCSFCKYRRQWCSTRNSRCDGLQRVCWINRSTCTYTAYLFCICMKPKKYLGTCTLCVTLMSRQAVQFVVHDSCCAIQVRVWLLLMRYFLFRACMSACVVGVVSFSRWYLVSG